MLLLSSEDIRKVFTMKDAIEADKEAFRLFSQGRAEVPLRTHISVPKHDGQCLFMPAYVEDIDAAGIKIVSVFPGNIKKGKPSVPAKMILLNGETGEVACIMDGTYLTRLRTGAAAGAASDIFARKDSKAGALFGTGGQAESQLEAMATVRNLEVIKVFDINEERAREFAKRMQKELENQGVRIVSVSNSEDAVRDADIITTVTTSKKPVFDGQLIKEGAHINGVGSYTPEMQELDEYLIINADKVYTDSKKAVLAEAGDLIIPINHGTIGESRITGDIGEVIAGRLAGRQDSREITVFKTVGIAATDVVTAHRIYLKAIESGIGQKVEI